MASRGATIRAVARSSSTSSMRSAPLATSHSQRAAGRSPTTAVVSASSWRQLLASFTGRPSTGVLGQLAGPFVGRQRGDDVVEIAGQHVGQSIDREPDAVVGGPVLLEVVGADLLAPPAATDLRAALDRALDVALVLGPLEQPGPQHLHRPLTVLQLAAL